MYDTPPDFFFDSTEILKIWCERVIFKLSEMVADRNKEEIDPEYLS